MEDAYDSLIGLGSESLVNLGIFADGFMIVDTEGVICCCKIIRSCPGLFEENAVIGKNLLDIYPELTKETSYVYKAIRGVSTINQFTERQLATGDVVTYLENDYPIKQNGTIIGAICIVKLSNFLLNEVDLPDNLNESRCTQSTVLPSSIVRKSDRYQLCDIIGESLPVRLLKERILQTAKTNSSVFLSGQTGTGKELVAQSIYSESSRSKGRFLSQNCAAIPANLFESLFFGTTRGSYTGALDKAGIFEQAKGGVIFLDEINSMDIAMQAKLLKVIEEKRLTRIGSSESVEIDVRIIAAINEPPLQSIQTGKLRRDLFYRLSAVQIELPSLTERKADIPMLTQYFIRRYQKEINPLIHGVSPRVASLFQSYSWPGNVRELKNALEGAFNFSKGALIQLDDLPGYLKDRLAENERTEGNNEATDGESGTAEPRNKAMELRNEVARLRNGTTERRDGTAEPRNEAAELRNGTAEPRNEVTELRDGTAEPRNEAAELRNGTAELQDGTTEPRNEALSQASVRLGSKLLPQDSGFSVIPLKNAVEEYEKDYILLRIPFAKSLTDLAQQLGLTRQALNYKLKKYNIKP